jgi:hypothetical protein
MQVNVTIDLRFGGFIGSSKARCHQANSSAPAAVNFTNVLLS